MTVTSFSYLFREQPSPPEAYYGAWFFIPSSVQVGSWLSLHHFGHHRTAGSPEPTPLWDFNVYPGPDGNVGGGSNDIAPSPATVYFDDATISLTRVHAGVGQ